jgi:hypothetical protein
MTVDKRRDIENTGKQLVKAGFIARIIGEFITITAPLGVMSIILFNIMLSNDTIPNHGMMPIILAILFYFIIPLLFPILAEIKIKRHRDELGLSYWKNVSEELDNIHLKEKLAKEQRAYSELGVGRTTDKTDIRYWKGLLDDGIITQEEFAAKKEELL